MFDTRPALADMAGQIRNCRTSDGLTLQQLAARSGVAASTIHKVETQQMVPTVSVLLKIAKGLGRPPKDLVRDEVEIIDTPTAELGIHLEKRMEEAAREALTRRDATQRAGVWRLDLAADRPFPTIELAVNQRAIVLVDQGGVDLQAGDRSFELQSGDCIEIEGGRAIIAGSPQLKPAHLTLIVTPPGELEIHLGPPSAVQPTAI